MSLQKQFNEFEENIRLTWKDEKIKKIRDKSEDIIKEIKTKFKEEGYPVIETFKQGSYATKTTIIPLSEDDYDIDDAIVIKSDDAPDDPTKPKKIIRDVLKNRNLKDPKIKKPCVTAQYYKEGEKHFHLDYPLYKKDFQDRYYLAIGKENSSEENKSWDESEVKELINWVDKKDVWTTDEAHKQYKRIIRYMKKWRDHVFTGSERKHIYSIGLTVMVKECFKESITFDGEINDLDSLSKTVESILISSYFSFTGYDNDGKEKYQVEVTLPKKPNRDIFEKHGQTLGTLFKNKLEKLQENLEKIKNEEKTKKQCERLSEKVFGNKFPIPEEKRNDNKKFAEAGYVASPQGA